MTTNLCYQFIFNVIWKIKKFKESQELNELGHLLNDYGNRSDLLRVLKLFRKNLVDSSVQNYVIKVAQMSTEPITFSVPKQPPEVFYKKGILKNFSKFIGKHLFQSLFFNKVVGLQACNSIKKETLAQLFPFEFC